MMEASSTWDSQDPTLSVPSQDDFQQFLDMGMNNLSDNLQFDFPEFNHQQSAQAQLMHQNGAEAMDTRMESGGSTGQDVTMQEHMASMTTTTNHPAIHGGAISNAQSSSDSLTDLDAQIQYLQHQRHQQQQRQMHEQQRNFYSQNQMIPPTPNSMELHSGNAQFYTQSDPQQQAMYERYRMQKEHDMSFTPLVSPAVTPMEPHFNIPEYTIPGAYFSPLSSPALHAQNEHSSVYNPRNSGTTNSPVDLNNGEIHSAPASSAIPSRIASKRASQKPRSVRTVRQSPIVKPRKSKKPSTSLSAQALGEIMEPANVQITRSKAASSNASTEESENGSISPEHLSDMAPPPIPTPGSSRSPYITSQKDNPKNPQLVLGSPATPASLMRMTQSPQVNEAGNNPDMDIDQGMEGFALPEAANTSRPKLPPIDTQSDGQITPTMASAGAKTPGFQPLPSPAFNRSRTAGSASQSPQIDSMNGGRKPPQNSVRGSKKRGSTSVLASPALLPRISPSIQPLISGSGNVSENTASLLLASKSNYQNILEGTHLPGVSYPSELSTNLTSKRTSHKIAEQGRRNRINSALQEIATLLPRGAAKDSSGEKSGSGDAGEPNDAGGNGKGVAQSANSKASTVENAIEYIKQLKKELADANKRAEDAEKKLSVGT